MTRPDDGQAVGLGVISINKKISGPCPELGLRAVFRGI
jgi:hypothetical protein